MKVIFPMRIDAFTKPGGDTILVKEFTKHLGSLGAITHITDQLNYDFSDYDIVHLTNIDRPLETFHYFTLAKNANKKIVISAIHHSYVDIARYECEGRSGLLALVLKMLKSFNAREHFKNVIRALKKPELFLPAWRLFRVGMQNAQKIILSESERVFLQAIKEGADIKRDIVDDLDNLRIIYNGVSLPRLLLNTTSVAGHKKRDIDVLVVARIESRKNQLKILEAVEKLGIKAVFLGGENPFHKSYAKYFRSKLIGTKSEHMAAISHEMLPSLYERARVHVSASWFEVSSLVDLEAFAYGCAIVSSECGCTKELLADKAYYVDPADTNDIAEKITWALKSKLSVGNADFVINAFSWAKAANSLLHEYHEISGTSVGESKIENE